MSSYDIDSDIDEEDVIRRQMQARRRQAQSFQQDSQWQHFEVQAKEVDDDMQAGMDWRFPNHDQHSLYSRLKKKYTQPTHTNKFAALSDPCLKQAAFSEKTQSTQPKCPKRFSFLSDHQLQQAAFSEKPKKTCAKTDSLHQHSLPERVLPSSHDGMCNSFAKRFTTFLGKSDQDSLNNLSKMEDELEEYKTFMDQADIRAAMISETQRRLEDEDAELARKHQRLEEAKAELLAKEKSIEEAKAKLSAEEMSIEEIQAKLDAEKKRLEETQAAINAEEQCLEEDKTAIKAEEQALLCEGQPNEVEAEETLPQKAFFVLPFLLALLYACMAVAYSIYVLGDHAPRQDAEQPLMAVASDIDAWLYLGSYVVDTYIDVVGGFFSSLL